MRNQNICCGSPVNYNGRARRVFEGGSTMRKLTVYVVLLSVLLCGTAAFASIVADSISGFSPTQGLNN